MSAQETIERLFRERAFGRNMDLVGFVDKLLLVAASVAEIQCIPVDDNRLRFTIDAEPPFEVELDHGMGKLRMMCARLAVLSSGSGDPMLYGGQGVICLPGSSASGDNGETNKLQSSLHVSFNNTPGKVWFIIKLEDRIRERAHASEELHA